MNEIKHMGQYPTPAWAAEMLVARHFHQLTAADTVLEPSCGDGRFLLAVPEHVLAYGVELDPLLADQARRNTGREIITGDFRDVVLPHTPTAVIGNPPFTVSTIDEFLTRCHDVLEYEGRVGLILPAYYFQVARRVVRLSRQWSISQELLPRNLFDGLAIPILFANFRKSRKTVLSGFFLYAETEALESLQKKYRAIFWGNRASPRVWEDAFSAALQALGGRASLDQIYSVIENDRPTPTAWWREALRKIARQCFEPLGDGRYTFKPNQQEDILV